MYAHTYSSSGKIIPSLNPPPPPPKEPPALRSFSPTSNVILNPTKSQSPVRRKPLPPTAFSPTSTNSPTSRETSPQQLAKALPITSVRRPVGGTIPKNSWGHEYVQINPHHDVQPHAREQQLNAKTLSSSDSFGAPLNQSRSYSISTSRTNGPLPRRPSNDLPKPLRRVNTQPEQSDDYPRSLEIVGEDMAFRMGSRPPPVRTDSASSTKSQVNNDQKKPQTPGGKFTSFFSRKPTTSPGAESSGTDMTDQDKSPLPSPYPASSHSAKGSSSSKNGSRGPNSQSSQESIDFDGQTYLNYAGSDNLSSRYSVLEAELKDITTELAHSIKREMDLEDMVEKLQLDAPSVAIQADRTSDYFSDSGTSSIRPLTSEINPKEEVERIKRETDQLRAQLKIDMSLKWQNEASARKSLESQLQTLAEKFSLSQRDSKESSTMTAKTKELEVTLEDAKRRIKEEKKTKENFEDLLTALREDLEQHKSERDNLRDEVVPQLRSRIEGLESSLSDAQKSPYDAARMAQELQSLRDENAAFRSARAMNMQFDSIAEENDATASPGGFFSKSGLGRSGTLSGRGNNRNTLTRSNSNANRAQTDSPQSLADQLKAIEQQRDALHSTVKSLIIRQEQQTRTFTRKLNVTEAERDRATSLTSVRKGGFEKEVRTLRSEINLLRKRTDDALEQKWQCEKGLAGLKMDLDRSKQETESLHKLLQARDTNTPEALSSSLEQALQQLQQQRDLATHRESLGSIEVEQRFADQLESSADRAEALASQVKQQLKANSSLRTRLREAIEKGELNQKASAGQINELQSKLRQLEDMITSAQIQSETAVMKHEEDIRVLRASTNVQLLRPKSMLKNSNIFSPGPNSPMSPMFNNSKKSPRLDKTSSGPGMALNQVLKTEHLEKKVTELEKALADADKEMEEVVSRMNTAQIGVAELEAEKDEALRQTRKLEAEIKAEREKVQQLLNNR